MSFSHTPTINDTQNKYKKVNHHQTGLGSWHRHRMVGELLYMRTSVSLNKIN